MPDVPEPRLLEALLDSWDRNNTILVNLLHAIPADRLNTRSDGERAVDHRTVCAYSLRAACICSGRRA
jgi:hypothetical protein